MPRKNPSTHAAAIKNLFISRCIHVLVYAVFLKIEMNIRRRERLQGNLMADSNVLLPCILFVIKFTNNKDINNSMHERILLCQIWILSSEIRKTFSDFLNFEMKKFQLNIFAFHKILLERNSPSQKFLDKTLIWI